MIVNSSDEDRDSLNLVGDDDYQRQVISIPTGRAKAKATPHPFSSGTHDIPILDVIGKGASHAGHPPMRTSDEGASHVAGRGRTRLGLGE